MTAAKGKVLVAMSGGVDSSVAAALLRLEGYDVVGCFMRLGSPGETLDELMPVGNESGGGACAMPGGGGEGGEKRVSLQIRHQGCCSINDAADARAVAAELGIPFYVCNFKKDFGRIIDYFVDEYAAGRTPNPCVRCNDWLKFGKLHDYAEQIGAGFVASGHYARIGSAEDGGAARLMRGVDHSKDQSYVLFGMPRGHLASTLLPIGGYQKTRVREMAREFGLPVFDKPDSQEICFVPDNDYASLVEQRRPGLMGEGKILDASGRELGRHGGQHRFTIGQRRGIGVATGGPSGAGEPVFVVGKDPATNTITVGPRERLMVSGCTAGEANWLAPERLAREGEWTACLAKYRYNTPAAAARVRVIETGMGSGGNGGTPSGRSGAFEVVFDQPQQAVAPGQAVVLYEAAEPDVVLGGGWITGTTR